MKQSSEGSWFCRCFVVDCYISYVTDVLKGDKWRVIHEPNERVVLIFQVRIDLFICGRVGKVWVVCFLSYML